MNGALGGAGVAVNNVGVQAPLPPNSPGKYGFY